MCSIFSSQVRALLPYVSCLKIMHHTFLSATHFTLVIYSVSSSILKEIASLLWLHLLLVLVLPLDRLHLLGDGPAVDDGAHPHLVLLAGV